MYEHETIKEVKEVFKKVDALKMDRQWEQAEMCLRAALRSTRINLGKGHPLNTEVRKRIRQLFEAEIAYNAVKPAH